MATLSDADYKKIVECSREAVSLNIDGEIIYVNEAFEGITGYSAKESIGEHIDFFHTEQMKEKIRAITRIRQSGGDAPQIYNAKIVHKSGKEIDVEYNVKLVQIGDKNASLTFIRDISERLQHEKRLETLYIHAKRINEAASIDEIFKIGLEIITNQFGYDHVAIAIVEEDSLHFKYGNGLGRTWEEFRIPLNGKGITTKAVKTKSTQLVPDTRKSDDFFMGIVTTSSPFLSELDIPVIVNEKVIAVINIESRIVNNFNEQDERTLDAFSNIMGFAIERLSLREQQIQNSNMLNALLNNLPILTRRLDEEGVITEHRGLLLEQYGLKQGQSTGRNFLDMYPDFSDEIQRGLNGHLVEFERRFVWNGEKKAWRNFLIPANHVHETISFAIDISDLRNAEDELVKNERLSAIGRISSIVGHELRNPLGVINNSRYYLGLKLKDSEPKVKRHLDIIQSEVDRSNVIISDLLDFARGPKPPMLANNDLNSIVKSAVQRVKIPPNITMKLELGEIPIVKVDSDMILRVIINLLSNAVDAIKKDGTITITTQIKDSQAVITVQDTGVGITSEEMSNLFQPLYTTKSKGVGLGLYTSKSLVEAHKGVIDVESIPGEGTVFTVKLSIDGVDPI